MLSIARKPHIAGLRSYHGKVMPGRAKWDPIISPERFDALQAATVMAEVIDVAGKRKRIGRAQRDTSRKWLLTGGIARCSRCKAPLAVVKLPRPEGYISGYGCSKRSGNRDACGGLNVTPAELVEELVVTLLKERLSSPAPSSPPCFTTPTTRPEPNWPPPRRPRSTCRPRTWWPSVGRSCR